MPATVLQPRLLQVRTQYFQDPDTGDIPENVLWFQSATTGTPTLANLATMASHFDTAWANVWSPVGSSRVNYQGSIWTDYSSTSGLSYTSVGTFSAVLGGSTGSAPPNVAVLISLSNGVRFRGGHFRIYLPWIGLACISTTDPSNLINTAPPAVSSAFSSLNAATTGSGVLGGQSQVLYAHRTNATKAALYPITSFTVRTRLASQRRRLRKAPHK